MSERIQVESAAVDSPEPSNQSGAESPRRRIGLPFPIPVWVAAVGLLWFWALWKDYGGDISGPYTRYLESIATGSIVWGLLGAIFVFCIVGLFYRLRDGKLPRDMLQLLLGVVICFQIWGIRTMYSLEYNRAANAQLQALLAESESQKTAQDYLDMVVAEEAANDQIEIISDESTQVAEGVWIDRAYTRLAPLTTVYEFRLDERISETRTEVGLKALAQSYGQELIGKVCDGGGEVKELLDKGGAFRFEFDNADHELIWVAETTAKTCP